MQKTSAMVLVLLIIASALDLVANAMNVIPILGTVGESTTEALLEVIQILGATFLALKR